MTSPVRRRRFLRNGLLLTGIAGPLAGLTGGRAAAAATTTPLPAIDAGPARIVLPNGAVGPLAVRTGVQFTGTLQANQTLTWFTFNWPASLHVIWHAISNTPRAGVIQVDSTFAVERASFDYITYYITIRNRSNEHVDVEGRFAVLNQ